MLKQPLSLDLRVRKSQVESDDRQTERAEVRPQTGPQIARKAGHMESSEADRVAHLMHEAGVLKLLPRAGWAYCGISSPESVAEHSFRAALIA